MDSTMSASPARSRPARAMPSGTNDASMPAAATSPPHQSSLRSNVAETVPSTAARTNAPVPAPTGFTMSSWYAFAARIDSCGEDMR
jgi:hypothetical protein